MKKLRMFCDKHPQEELKRTQTMTEAWWVSPCPECAKEAMTPKMHAANDARFVDRNAEQAAWIPVSERLPECVTPKAPDLGWIVYKPFRPERKIDVTYIVPSWWMADDGTTNQITHWMPLPQAPNVPLQEGRMQK